MTATDVVEVDVDAVGGKVGESVSEIGGLVVEGGVEGEVVGEERDLVVGAGAADHAAAADACQLSGDGTHGAGGARDEDGLARLGVAEVEEADVGGEAGAAKALR